MKYTLKLSDAEARETFRTGGKGSSLARLAQAKFPVPGGFALTAEAYRQFGSGELRRKPSEATPIPDDISTAIADELERFPATQRFAVRSSATLEDLQGAAFAGQHDTFLNCLGTEEVLGAGRDCFLSLWSDRAVAYREQRGFSHDQALMAVVIQEMVDCDVAGVGFSLNPVSGRLDETVFDSNHGLGESVVGGEMDVDHFVLNKATGQVNDSVIASKTRKIVYAESGTTEVEVDAAEAAGPSLDAGQLGQLNELLKRVEAFHRFPQDIEWGFRGNDLFLLQARPVSIIPERWTRDESAERFPDPITPLTLDFLMAGFHRSLKHSFELMDYPPFEGKWFESFGHYIYGNQNVVMVYGGRSPFNFSSIGELTEQIPRLREEFRWVQELPAAWMRDLDSYLIRIGEFNSERMDTLDLTGLWAHIKAINEHGADYFLPNIAISITQAQLHRLLLGLLKNIVPEDRAMGMFDELLSFTETKTGIINKELFHLAKRVRAEAKLERLILETGSRDIIDDSLLDGFPGFNDTLAKFLKNHGHREISLDPYHPTWGDAPWLVLDNLRLILQSPMDVLPEENERLLKVRMQQAELELQGMVPPELQFFFHEIIRLCRLYTNLDDLEHYQTTRLTPPLRRGLIELGSRLKRLCVVDDPLDVFMAGEAALDKAIASENDEGWDKLRAIIQANKSSFAQAQATEPAWTLEEHPAAPATEGQLTGIPGSAGIAEGAVYRVEGPEDFAGFPKGGILLARTTNPTWTPLFYLAAGVVTQSGGPLSHGAVTAREMQVPAVMSVQTAWESLKTGDRVRVDGVNGTVTKL